VIARNRRTVSDLQRFQHPRFARIYERISAEAESRGATGHRVRLLAGARGDVLEVGAGNGLNLAHYPREVTSVIAVEPDDTLRDRAVHAARDAPVSVEVRAGHVDALPAGDASVDVVVASLVQCSVPDQASALNEILRVLKPGGELRYYEHIRSKQPIKGLVEDAITPLWTRIAGGCHPNRRTDLAITDAGFDVDRHERFVFRPVKLSVSFDHVIGVARRRRATAGFRG
jgi:SAM-dependent methyltransferase